MRWAFGLVGLLVVMAIVLTMAARQTQRTLRTAGAPIPSLREDIAAQAFDRDAVREAIARLEGFVDLPELPVAEINDTRADAAGWAAGSTPGSREYRAAVKLRGAADALLAVAGGDEGKRQEARRCLREANEALASPAAMPGGAVGGLRDQIENLQHAQQEKLQEAGGADQ